jgi:hypothetical protein
MNNIIDPVNGNSYDIFSLEGKNLLKNYVKVFQNGGRWSSLESMGWKPTGGEELENELENELESEKIWCDKPGNILERPYCSCIKSNDTINDCKGPFLGITKKFTPHKKIVQYHKNNTPSDNRPPWQLDVEEIRKNDMEDDAYYQDYIYPIKNDAAENAVDETDVAVSI